MTASHAARPDSDDAVIIAALGVALGIRRAARTLADRRRTAHERTRLASELRVLVRAARGIPEPDQPKYPQAVVLNVAAWIDQARTEEHDALWLYRHCASIDERFDKVPAVDFQSAIQVAKKRGPRATQTVAVGLAKAAGIHAALGTVRNLKAASKRTVQPNKPARRARANTSPKR
jgi:hypothetical protein